MYVCVCNGVNERDIRNAVEAGARDLGDLQRELGVASGCGQCEPHAQCLLREARRESRSSVPSLQPA
jgi:bacterioferritin-associated ferredoxin